MMIRYLDPWGIIKTPLHTFTAAKGFLSRLILVDSIERASAQES